MNLFLLWDVSPSKRFTAIEKKGTNQLKRSQMTIAGWIGLTNWVANYFPLLFLLYVALRCYEGNNTLLTEERKPDFDQTFMIVAVGYLNMYFFLWLPFKNYIWIITLRSLHIQNIDFLLWCSFWGLDLSLPIPSNYH